MVLLRSSPDAVLLTIDLYCERDRERPYRPPVIREWEMSNPYGGVGETYIVSTCNN